VPALADGIDVVPVAVGVFAGGAALFVASRLRHGPVTVMGTRGRWMTRDDFRRSWKPWLRGTALGFPIGAMPAGGAEVPTFLSYALEKKLTKHPEEFGHGAIEGVAGPEAANNASAAGVLVPLLTLGLPTSATAAVIIAAFQSYGIRPGPLLFQSEGALVWALIASLYVGNVLLLVLNLPLVGLWVRVLQIPRHYLYAGIMTFAALGAYAINGVRDDLLLLLAIGVLGFAMRRFGYPIAPAVIGLILGPIAEEQLRRTLAISQGDPVALVDSPFAAVVYSLLVLAVVVTVVVRLRRRSRSAVGKERVTV
jgi:putative tricarboxylic transport membrane protein